MIAALPTVVGADAHVDNRHPQQETIIRVCGSGSLHSKNDNKYPPVVSVGEPSPGHDFNKDAEERPTMRILFASDLELVRESFKSHLQQLEPTGEVVVAPCLDTALTVALAEVPFDLVLVDSRALGSAGAAALEPLRVLLPNVPLAILAQGSISSEVLGELPQVGVSVISMGYSGPLLLSVLKFVAGGELHVSAQAPPLGFVTTTRESVGNRPFTPREHQVLSLLSQGLRNKEIARHLMIEEVTVRMHLRGIFRKLDVRNRTQAVKCAIERGLISFAERPVMYPPIFERAAAAL